MFIIHNQIKNLVIHLISFISLLLLMIPSFVVAEGEYTFAEAKAYYTLEIAKHIIWPNEGNMNEIIIGLIGVDQEVKAAFDQRRTTIIRGKALKLEYLNDTNFVLDRYSIIFIAEKKRSLNSQIFSRVANALIITDGKVDKEEQMVSLISSSRKVSVTLNRDNLSVRGFKVSIDLLDLAGTKKDLSNQLRDNESRLKILLDQVENKERTLVDLNDNLRENSALLDSAKRKLNENKKILDKNRSQLDSLLDEIEASREEVRKNLLDIDGQKNLIEQKQTEVILKENEILLKENKILLKEKEVSRLQTSIQENQTILDQQSSMIDQQSDTIRNKNKMIVVIAFITLVFIVMIHLLLRANKLRKRSNEELEHLNSKLYELATTDGMTNLFNRRHFLEIAQKEFNRQQRHKCECALLMLDIDNFKKVNDKYGHAMGDEVIKTVARSLNGNLREYDLVGRIGGEEFAMMLVNCDIELASEIANRLCNEISEKDIIYSGVNLKITISIGLSQLDAGDTNIEQTLNRADKALYKAKESGRNRVVIYSD